MMVSVFVITTERTDIEKDTIQKSLYLLIPVSLLSIERLANVRHDQR